MKGYHSDIVIEIIGLKGIPDIKAGDDIGKIICEKADEQIGGLRNGDIVVVASKIVAKSEGRIVKLSDVQPSPFAIRVAELTGKSPELVELILRESNKIVRMRDGHLIVETKHGFICANAGIDRSNVAGGEDVVALLPEDPDQSAKRIRMKIAELKGIDVAVIISDTFGRAWRRGHVNFAVGISGIKIIKDYRGMKDMYGYILSVTQMAVVDELAAAAELAMGKSSGVPIVIIRGYEYPRGEDSIKEIFYPEEKDLFR
ncbi:MAG: coenzyme F420-0:L-glutamate ligase [Candidatus Methanomethylicia archaeon]|nr:coenzyme F420-0:L-glutamate ligase [Candidatus Methanomethylicia archaeon]MCX8168841.1 coenzyme F420-0:L-glutamate ligase [Candidatus Methanomethylicia archaeon]MDW7988573.1 coenzyme F420-0:L-glutamate ligase [Nitrososphaerota archaeon]